MAFECRFSASLLSLPFYPFSFQINEWNFVSSNLYEYARYLSSNLISISDLCQRSGSPNLLTYFTPFFTSLVVSSPSNPALILQRNETPRYYYYYYNTRNRYNESWKGRIIIEAILSSREQNYKIAGYINGTRIHGFATMIEANERSSSSLNYDYSMSLCNELKD